MIGQTTDSSNLPKNASCRERRFYAVPGSIFVGFFKNNLKKYFANPIIVIEMKWGGP